MGISIWQLLIILLIVVLLFGTKKLSSLGKDLGGAMRGFRDAVRDPSKQDDEDLAKERLEQQESDRIIEGKVESNEKEKV